MNKVVLIFVLLIPLVIDVNGQVGGDFSEIRKKELHADLDIKNIFNGLGGAGILVKKKIQTGDLIDVDAINLIRMSLRLNTTSTLDGSWERQEGDVLSFHDINQDMHQAYLFGNELDDKGKFRLGLGYEKQIVNDGFVHYFGVDAVFIYSYEEEFDDHIHHLYNQNEPDVFEAYHNRIETFEYGINPFIGIKYYLTNRLSIGVETGFKITYFNNEVDEIVEEIEQVDHEKFEVTSIEEITEDAKGIKTRFNNLRHLTIGYVFGE